MEKYTLDIFLSTLVVERVINKMHKMSEKVVTIIGRE
jgi:hypothetical protein